MTMADLKIERRELTRKSRLLIATCFILMGLAAYAVAQAGNRLILKDGTWQGITTYEVRGDRIRYFSSQRWEWEEVPRELVNWKATEEWNGRSKEKSPDLGQLEADEEAERKAEAAEIPTVAPGVRLPNTGGVFILDTFSGQLSLNELAQTGSEVNNNLRSAFNRKATFTQQFELRWPHARVQTHNTLPEIFVNVNVDPNARQIALSDRFRILRLESKKDSRVLVSVTVSVLGKQNQSPQFVPTRIERFKGCWLKIIPMGALEPGEFALVEILGKNEFNSYAWDFGVGSDAPAIPHLGRQTRP